MKKLRPLVIILCLWPSVLFLSPAADLPHSFQPRDGFVPDEQTAIRIAHAVWFPIYGEKHILSEAPFVATLKDGIWTVQGSLPKGRTGGVAIAEIAQQDARIIRVSHGK